MSDHLKVHISLDSSDVARSTEFYRAFFGADPVKVQPGYTKFELADPALNFTLNQARPDQASSGGLNHLGIQVSSSEAVRRAADRLSQAGLATWEEMDTDCCYALQDKVWVQDPDGYRWEVFLVKEDTDGRSTRRPHPAATAKAGEPDCCAAECCS